MLDDETSWQVKVVFLARSHFMRVVISYSKLNIAAYALVNQQQLNSLDGSSKQQQQLSLCMLSHASADRAAAAEIACPGACEISSQQQKLLCQSLTSALPVVSEITVSLWAYICMMQSHSKLSESGHAEQSMPEQRRQLDHPSSEYSSYCSMLRDCL